MLSAEILKRYPSVDTVRIQSLLDTEIASGHKKLVVLDDDPTGVQTVHDVSVYTDWSYESVRRGFSEKNRLFYILTNSRGFTVEETIRAHHEIGETIAKVAAELSENYVIISRGDSTLRGHYPLETEVLREEMERISGKPVDGEILCPYFKEGGRFTIDNIHYVKYGDTLIPVGETEFARDATFGYHASDLREYIEEKTGGKFLTGDVTTISLEELRGLDYDGIKAKLCAVRGFGKVVVNAVDACDLKVFCTALYRALAAGHTFLFRTAAGFVKEFGGISDRPLLSSEELAGGSGNTGGIVVVGSHTKKTTAQLEALRGVSGLSFLEFNSDLVLDEEAFVCEINRVLAAEEEIIRSGRTAVVYTRRKALTAAGDTPEAALRRSVKISDAVQSLVGRLSVKPSFVVAKGGITSSDVGTKALHVKRAIVMGQIRPGIPVWKTGAESRFPGIPYVIFPGNVGENNTLRETVEILLGRS